MEDFAVMWAGRVVRRKSDKFSLVSAMSDDFSPASGMGELVVMERAVAQCE
jgi:hypothetical protein